MKIEPKGLFADDILDYRVQTESGEKRYVNLDNAATTPPFKVVQEKVARYLTSYGSLHRGAGEKSKRSTDIYEQSREVFNHCALQRTVVETSRKKVSF